MTSSNLNTFVTGDACVPASEILAELEEYLLRYPEEAIALLPLRSQLEDPVDEWYSRKNMRGHVTTSGLVLSHDLESVLQIHHNVYQLWLEPGGHYEGEGSLVASTLREVDEETGVRDIELVPLSGARPIAFDIDTHKILANTSKEEGEHAHHDFIYLLRATRHCALAPQLEEVSAARWLPMEIYMAQKDTRSVRMAEKLKRVIAALKQ